jgi:hypothetical protein
MPLGRIYTPRYDMNLGFFDLVYLSESDSESDSESEAESESESEAFRPVPGRKCPSVVQALVVCACVVGAPRRGPHGIFRLAVIMYVYMCVLVLVCVCVCVCV